MEGGKVTVDGRLMHWFVINLFKMPSMTAAGKTFIAYTDNRDRSVRLELAADTPALSEGEAASLVSVADAFELTLQDGSLLLLTKQWHNTPLGKTQIHQRQMNPTGDVWGRWHGTGRQVTSLNSKCIGSLSDNEIGELLEQP